MDKMFKHHMYLNMMVEKILKQSQKGSPLYQPNHQLKQQFHWNQQI